MDLYAATYEKAVFLFQILQKMNTTKMSLITGILFFIAGVLMLASYVMGKRDTLTMLSAILFLAAGGMQLYVYSRRRKQGQ